MEGGLKMPTNKIKATSSFWEDEGFDTEVRETFYKGKSFWDFEQSITDDDIEPEREELFWEESTSKIALRKL